MSNICKLAMKFALIAGIFAPHLAQAANFTPTKAVKIVVPFAVGSSSDLWSRVLAMELEKKWDQPVIVENKPGASGMIATRYVSRAAPDGHTLLAGSQSTAMGKIVQGENLDFDPQEALAPVYKFVGYQMVIVANAGQGVDTLSGLVEQSEKQEGGLFFGGYGPTSVINTVNSVIAKGIGLKFTSVDFPGPAQIFISLVRGDTQYTINTLNAVKTQVDSGQLKILSAISDERFPSIPDVPSLRETGYKGYIPKIWNGLFTSSDTPPAVLDAIAADLRDVISDTGFRESLESKISGTLRRNSSPEEFQRELSEETEVWKGIFKP